MKFISFLFFSLFLTSCHPDTPWDETCCRGKIQDGTYYDPDGYFSVQLPSFPPPALIQEETPGPETSIVSFRSPKGDLMKVELQRGLFAKKIVDEDGKKAEKVFNSLVLPQLTDKTPSLKKVKGEIVLEEEKKPAYFAIVELAGPPKIQRGIFVFLDKEGYVVLSYQDSEANLLKENLLEIRNSYVTSF